jgi:Leucine-rich repeat (LRR) protein
MIEKITGISSLKNLKILSLGRNYIKNFSGLVTTILSFFLISFIYTERFKRHLLLLACIAFFSIQPSALQYCGI